MTPFFSLPPELSGVANFLAPYLLIIWLVVKAWWWLALPFILWRPFCFLWLWWRNDIWLNKQKSVMLDMRIPKEILKPTRAMETVMAGIRQTMYQPPDWWEKWVDGQVQLSVAFEIVSLNGDVHFFVRIPASARDSIEAIIYGQYPDAEITEAEDYSRKVPQDIPNKDWDMWGSDYRLLKPDAFPIKTYVDFETEREVEPEQKIDPLAGLLEAMGKVKPGEQLWLQILAEPVSEKENKWISKGMKVKDELARRVAKPKKENLILADALKVIVTGNPASDPEKEKEVMPPEMKLTPGEKDVITAVEKKLSKPAYVTSIRFIYLGKREVFFKSNLRLVFGFFASLATEHLNSPQPWGKTMTKIHKSWFLPLNLLFKRRVYMRQRKLFKNYTRRVTPLFPYPGGTFIFNVEEMATIFHFPSKGAVPALSFTRIESKKAEAPPDLPIEE